MAHLLSPVHIGSILPSLLDLHDLTLLKIVGQLFYSMSPQFGFVWFFFMTRFKLSIFGRSIRKVIPNYSHCILSTDKQIHCVPLLGILNISTWSNSFFQVSPVVKSLSFTFIIDKHFAQKFFEFIEISCASFNSHQNVLHALMFLAELLITVITARWFSYSVVFSLIY